MLSYNIRTGMWSGESPPMAEVHNHHDVAEPVAWSTCLMEGEESHARRKYRNVIAASESPI